MKYLLFFEGKVKVVDQLPAGYLLPEEPELFRFDIDEESFVAFDAVIADPEFEDLRASYMHLPARDYAAASKGAELLYWNRSMRHCPACGGVLTRAGEICKVCCDCKREYFPQLSPAVIVLVEKGNQALLVHARTFRHPVFGLVAGFVETGESLEESVIREVREETSLEIEDIRYFGSQSWPFPAQMMIGFTAKWKSGEIKFADGELTDGGFFTSDRLPQLPTLPSIARRMIEAWRSRNQESGSNQDF